MKKAIGFIVGVLAGAASLIFLLVIVNLIFGTVHIK